MAPSLAQARAAKDRLARELGSHPAVNGIGLARSPSGYGVKVNLAYEPEDGVGVPDEVDGVPVRVEVVGPITKQHASRRRSRRPEPRARTLTAPSR